MAAAQKHLAQTVKTAALDEVKELRRHVRPPMQKSTLPLPEELEQRARFAAGLEQSDAFRRLSEGVAEQARFAAGVGQSDAFRRLSENVERRARPTAGIKEKRSLQRRSRKSESKRRKR